MMSYCESDRYTIQSQMSLNKQIKPSELVGFIDVRVDK